MSRPLVSCIIPTFNSQRYLGEALASVLGQDYRPIEVIVADDGSTDGTAEIAAGFAKSVRWLAQPTAGPAATRNLGLSAARGPFVAFLDADDLWQPDKLSAQMARLQARPELDAVICHVEPLWEAEADGERRRLGGHPRARAVPGYVSSALLARREAFERVGPFDPSLWFGDSADWFVRAGEAEVCIEVMPEVLVRHRVHARNLTRRRRQASLDEFLRIVKKTLDRRRRCQRRGEEPT